VDVEQSSDMTRWVAIRRKSKPPLLAVSSYLTPTFLWLREDRNIQERMVSRESGEVLPFIFRIECIDGICCTICCIVTGGQNKTTVASYRA